MNLYFFINPAKKFFAWLFLWMKNSDIMASLRQSYSLFINEHIPNRISFVGI